MKDKDQNRFYVYTHARPDGSVFYVGKGCGNRSTSKANRNKHHMNITSKYGWENVLVTIVASNITEDEAFRLECDTIRTLKSSGVRLANISEGGEGPSGLVHRPDSRAKMVESQRRAWEVPGRRDAARANLRAISSLPHVKQARSEFGKKLLSDPKFKEAWVAASRARNADPEFQAKAAEGLRRKFATDMEFVDSLRARTKNMWANPEWRASRISQMSTLANSGEVVERNRRIISKVNDSPRHRSSQQKASRETSRRPEIQAARRSRILNVMSDPELNARRLKGFRDYYDSPKAKWDTAMQTANRLKIPYTMLNKNIVVWARKLPNSRKGGSVGQ